MTDERKPGDAAAWTFNEGVRSGGDDVGAVLKTVAAGVSSAAKGAGPAGVPDPDAVAVVVRSAVRGSPGGDLAVRAKAIVLGVIRGGGAKDEAALKGLAHAARTVIHQAARLRGDLGAIAGATQMGVDPARAAAAARGAAVEEAEGSAPWRPRRSARR